MRSNLTRRHRHRLEGFAAIAVLAALLIVGSAGGAKSATVAVPAGFQETTAFSGLTNPTVVRFASDGRVFVAEKSGVIKVFDNLSDTTPTLFADLRTNVHNFWDRGLARDGAPSRTSRPLRTSTSSTPTTTASACARAALGHAGATSDGCPTPPGATSDGCVVSGRLSRLQASGNVMTGSEQVLIEDWCQQFPSHSIGTRRVRPRRRPLRERRRRRELHLRRLRPGRQSRSTRAATRPEAWARP